MFHLLTILNNYANEKNLISDLIEVEVPFYNSQLTDKGFDFVIFDTPGSDAYSHKDHLNVLKNALSKEFTHIVWDTVLGERKRQARWARLPLRCVLYACVPAIPF